MGTLMHLWWDVDVTLKSPAEGCSEGLHEQSRSTVHSYFLGGVRSRSPMPGQVRHMQYAQEWSSAGCTVDHLPKSTVYPDPFSQYSDSVLVVAPILNILEGSQGV